MQQYFDFHFIQSANASTRLQAQLQQESKQEEFEDNNVITIMQDSKNGLFACLDFACKVPHPDVSIFLQELFKHHGKNTALTEVKAPKTKKKTKSIKV